jgi:hypothetical protein
LQPVRIKKYECSLVPLQLAGNITNQLIGIAGQEGGARECPMLVNELAKIERRARLLSMNQK